MKSLREIPCFPCFRSFHVTHGRNIALSMEADEDEGVESCNNEDKQGTPKRWMST